MPSRSRMICYKYVGKDKKIEGERREKRGKEETAFGQLSGFQKLARFFYKLTGCMLAPIPWVFINAIFSTTRFFLKFFNELHSSSAAFLPKADPIAYSQADTLSLSALILPTTRSILFII